MMQHETRLNSIEVSFKENKNDKYQSTTANKKIEIIDFCLAKRVH